MTGEHFEVTLRTFLRDRPFQPFIVELAQGDTILVDDPNAVAFDRDGAAYIGPEIVHFIEAENVIGMRNGPGEPIA